MAARREIVDSDGAVDKERRDANSQRAAEAAISLNIRTGLLHRNLFLKINKYLVLYFPPTLFESQKIK